MTKIRTKFARGLVVASAAVLGVIAAGGNASAAVDDQLSIQDQSGDTITVSQADTFLNGVYPLDRNPLTREWFHTGKASWDVSGPAAADFSGKIEIGYQVGYPFALTPSLTFTYSTPQLGLSIGSSVSADISDILPQAAVSVEIAPGPGIVEVVAASADVAGANGFVNLANFHGTVTGAAGGVSLRPFVRLTSAAGDSVTTYGDVWNMN